MAGEPAESASSGDADWRSFFGARVQFPLTMEESMLKFAIEQTRAELDKISDWRAEGDGLVLRLKESFDSAYGPNWHVIVGKHFGSKVSHEAHHLAFFYTEVRAGRGADGARRHRAGGRVERDSEALYPGASAATFRPLNGEIQPLMPRSTDSRETILSGQQYDEFLHASSLLPLSASTCVAAGLVTNGDFLACSSRQ